MKRLKYGLLAAAMVASAAVVPAAGVNAEAADGAWVKDAKGWHYQYEDGTLAKNEFVGGYWISAAGLMQTGHNYTWMLDGGFWRYGDKSWMAGLGYLDKEGDEKSQWCKIDGKWYYFFSDGIMAQNAFMGKYAVDENGVWMEDVTAKWEKDGEDWRYAVTDSEGTDYLADGWFFINGKWYHFNADATLDTWKVIRDVDSDGNKSYYGLGANGQRGRLTKFDFVADKEVEATLTLSFAGKSVTDRVNAAKDIKNFLINTRTVKSDNTGAYFFTATINGEKKQIGLAYMPKEDMTATTTEEGDTATTTYSRVTTKNVYVLISKEQYDWAIATNAETGKKNYDGTIAVYEFDGDKKTTEHWIPLVSYVNNFGSKDESTSASEVANDVTIKYTFSSLAELFATWRNLDTVSRYDHQVVIGKGTKNEMTITRLGVSQNYFGIDLDGQHYQAFIDIDNENFSNCDVYFLGDVSGATSTTKVLGKKLRALGLVTAFTVKSTDVAGGYQYGETTSIMTNGKPGKVQYADLEKAAAEKAADEKNAGNE